MTGLSDSENEIDRIARRAHPQRLPKNNDSSSSRESSPDGLQRQKRSFTPTSDDDGDVQIPAIPNDDTPPPPDRPVIRQALGFGSTAEFSSSGSTPLNTYQARPSTGKKEFLPGQSVAPPPKAKKTPKAKKVRKKKEDYATQTNRFRVSNYNVQFNPPESTDPSQSSSARSDTESLNPQTFPSAVSTPYTYPEPPQQSTRPDPPSYPIPLNESTASHHLPYFPSSQYMPSAYSIPPPPPLLTPYLSTTGLSQPAPQSHSPSQGKSAANANASAAKSPAKAAKQKTKASSASTRSQTAGSSTSVHPNSENSGRSSAYYRRDYETQADIDLDSLDTMSTGSVQGSAPQDSLPTVSKRKPDPVSNRHYKSSRIPSRMVTILMTDIRSGTEDHQLAEVVVPLKEVDSGNPDAGFWANAQEVVEKLQNNPSRVEGPARAYTMRGKYRQFFLRTREDGSYEASPANIGVSAERTLEVVVEEASLPGEMPVPPRIPRDLQPSPELDDISSNGYDDQEYRMRHRKRFHSPSVEGTADYDGSYSQQSTRHQSPSGYPTPKRKKVYDPAEGVDDSDAELFITPLTASGQKYTYEYDTATSDDEPDILEKKIVERVDAMIQQHPDWSKVFRLRAQLPRVPAYVDLYRILKSMFDKYGGRRVPFKSNRNLRIQQTHILSALRIINDDDEDLNDAEKVCSNCLETLRLVSLYGPEGTREVHPVVEEMMKDNSTPPKHTKPQKRFLRTLREIDKKWMEDAEKSPAVEVQSGAAGSAGAEAN